MTWLSPKSARDVHAAWENLDAAFDGDLDTAATTLIRMGEDWQRRVIFSWERAETTQIRFHITTSSETVIARARIGNEDLPDLWRQSGIPAGPHWIYIIFEPREFDVVQLDFNCRDADWVELSLNEIEAWVQCTGPLAPICNIFHDIGGFFSDLAGAISGVFVIGEHLASPFYSLSETFHDLGDTCCEASATLQEILDLLEEGLSWDEIGAMIAEHWPGLAALIADPVEWLLLLLQEHFTPLYYLIVDPAGELLYLIAQLFDLTPYEAQNGEFVIKALFERYFPELYLLWRDPDAWLQQRLEPYIEALMEEIRELLEATWERLMDTYEGAFGAISARLYTLAEHTIRFFWEGEW